MPQPATSHSSAPGSALWVRTPRGGPGRVNAMNTEQNSWLENGSDMGVQARGEEQCDSKSCFQVSPWQGFDLPGLLFFALHYFS